MTDRANPPEDASGRPEKALSEFEPTWTRGEPLGPDEVPRTHPDRGSILGDFRILREIGRGGMGVVYEAEQISLKRRVALKVLLPHLGLSEERVAKFRREAEAEGRQKHPGIVSIYAIGEQDGVHFIAQELIAGGRTLADKLREAREAGDLPRGYFRDVAALFAQVADALAHAHGNGVIHRDVKPSNILLDQDGAPHVGDFGLAKIEDALAQSRSGEFEGTPYYMSPEQVTRRKGGIDHRTDIFSLGVTLYEALTLTRPFDGETSLDVLRRVLQDDPAHPRRVNPRVPRSLSTICLKAMEKEPTARYATMQAFAADLRSWLAGETILARPAGPVTRSFKWVRRHRALAAAGMGALIVVLVAGSVLLYRHLAEERTVRHLMAEAEEAAQAARWTEAVDDLVRALSLRPEDSGLQDRHRLYAQQKELAAVRFERDEKEKALRRSEGLRLASEAGKLTEANPGLALLLAREAARRYPAVVTRNALADALAACRERRTAYLRRLPFLPEVQGTDRGWQRSIDISRDGGKVVTCAWDATPSVWNAETGERIAVLALPRPVRDRARTRYGVFSPDGRTVALTDVSHSAWIFDAETGGPIAELDAGHYPSFVTFSPDGRWLATAANDSTARIWNVATIAPIHVLRGHPGIVGCLGFTPDSRLLASGSGPEARIWDVRSGRELAVLPGHEEPVRSVAFSPDGRVLATVCDSGLRLWETASGRLLHRIPSHRGGVVSVWGVEFSPDGSRVTATWGDPVGRVWSVASGEEVLQLRGHQVIMRSIHFSPDGTRIVTGAFDNTARIWDAATGAELAVLRGHEDFLHDARFFPDGRRVATISEDGTLRIWDAPSGASRDPCLTPTIHRLFNREGSPDAADGRRLEIGRGDSSDVVWIRFPGEHPRAPIRLVHPHGSVLGGVCFSPDGSRVVADSYGPPDTGWLHVWDARTGERTHDLNIGLGVSFYGACLLNDNRELLSSEGDGTVRLWELATKAPKLTLRGHARWVRSVTFGGDGRRLVTASSDGTARVWDTTTERTLAVLRGHEGEVTAACLSPDGRWAITRSLDHTARLWNAETGEELWTLRDIDDAGVRDVGFHPDGERVVVVESDGTTRSRPVDVMAAAERLRPRDLTPDEKRRFAIWETGEEEALALVERLFAELVLARDVMARLEEDPSLADPVRQAAVRFVRGHEDDPQALLRTAELIQVRKDNPPDAIERGQRYQRAAARLIELTDLEVPHQAR